MSGKSNFKDELKAAKDQIKNEKIDEELEKTSIAIKDIEEEKAKEILNELDEKIEKGMRGEEEEKEEKEDDGILKLKKPFEGATEIHLDYSKITAQELIRIGNLWDRNRTNKREIVTLKALNDEYCVYVAHLLTGIRVSKLLTITGADSSALINKVRFFLLGA